MVNRLMVTLEQLEYAGLLKMAIGELRDPPDQLRFLLRQELVRRGLIGLERAEGSKEEPRPARGGSLEDRHG
jgi:hypothetical protein